MTQDLEYPKAIHAEMTILGAMMVDTRALSDAFDLLTAEDFFLDSHRRIFSAMRALQQSGSAVDLTTLPPMLAGRKEVDVVGGVGYLAGLSDGLPRNLAIDSYARIVIDCARRCTLMRFGEAMTAAAADGSEQAVPIQERFTGMLNDLALQQDDADLEAVGTYLASQGTELEAIGAMATTGGLKLGWILWDEATGGLQRKELTVVAAMASAGKTAWACNAVYHASVRENAVTAFFPLEQKKLSAVRRMLSAASGVEYQGIRSGILRSYDRTLLLEARARLSAAPLYMDDSPGMTMARIKSRCARLKHRVGLDYVVIDQLSHVDGGDVYRKGMTGEEVLGAQTLAAKRLSEELDVPVTLLTQMTQEGAKRPDPRPRITDIAGSGRIKNHADIVAFLHRPEMYDKDNPELKGKAEMIIAKNREGPTKTCHCEYDGRIMRWEDGRTQ